MSLYSNVTGGQRGVGVGGLERRTAQTPLHAARKICVMLPFAVQPSIVTEATGVTICHRLNAGNFSLTRCLPVAEIDSQGRLSRCHWLASWNEVVTPAAQGTQG